MHLKGRTILVVEDDFFLSEEISRSVVEEGGSVIGPVNSLAEAVDAVSRARRIDGAILDVGLAHTNVYPVASILRRKEIPFVFYSGCSRELLDPEFRTEPLIAKPARSAVLIRELADVVSMRQT